MSRLLLFGLLFVAACTIAIITVLNWQKPVREGRPTTPTTSPPTLEPVVRRDGPPIFRDVTAGSGLAASYRNGEEAEQFTILESLGGGVALIDYDGDGLLDIFVTGGGYFAGPQKTEIKGLPCKMFHNLGGWKFEDVTEQLGLGKTTFYSHGVAVADYDRDGWPDLLVTGYGKAVLFHNEPDPRGGRRFVDVSERVGLKDDSWSTSAAFADINGDGYPDLYVCHYVDWSFANNPFCKGDLPGVSRQVCPPQRFRPLRHAFFWNEAGKHFRDASVEQKFAAVGCGLGVVAADLNDDGRPDFYVANDATNNQLYLNRGGNLEERGVTAGVALDDLGAYNGSMGVDVGDFDGSGRPSIFVTNFQGDEHALYQNLGREIFQHQSRAYGIGALGQHLVGFGTAFMDFENDGWVDLIIAHGHVLQHPFGGGTYKQKPMMLSNTERPGKRFFEDISYRGGPFFEVPALGRGLAIGDLDNDGWSDVVLAPTNGPVALLRNVAGEKIPNHWIGLRLQGKDNRCIVGTTVIVIAGDRKLTRFVKSGGSYLSSSDPRVLVGLADYKGTVDIIVKWSWGKFQRWNGLKIDSYLDLQEGSTKVSEPPKSAPVRR